MSPKDNKTDHPKKYARQYPWDDWFNLREFTLIKGVDYDCQTSSMRLMTWCNAKKRRLKIATQTSDDKIIVNVFKKPPRKKDT